MNQEPTDQPKDTSTEDESSVVSTNNKDVTTPVVEDRDTQNEIATDMKSTESVNSTHQQEDSPTPSPTDQDKKSALIKIAIGIILILLLALIAFGLWKSYQPKQVELQGRVEAETIHVSTKVPSRIEEIYVHDGEKVRAGQELVRLTSPEVSAKKQQALAALQSAQALQSTAERGSQQENIDSLYANWQSLKAQQQLAQTTYQRGQNLFKEGVISRQRRDEMQAAAISAAQMTEASYQQYLRAQRGSTPQQQSSADAQVKIATSSETLP